MTQNNLILSFEMPNLLLIQKVFHSENTISRNINFWFDNITCIFQIGNFLKIELPPQPNHLIHV